MLLELAQPRCLIVRMDVDSSPYLSFTRANNGRHVTLLFEGGKIFVICLNMKDCLFLEERWTELVEIRFIVLLQTWMIISFYVELLLFHGCTKCVIDLFFGIF